MSLVHSLDRHHYTEVNVLALTFYPNTPMRREAKHSDRRMARKVMRASTKPFSHENCMTQEILMKKKAPELISLFK